MTSTTTHKRSKGLGFALAVAAVAALALTTGSAALAYGPSPFLHRPQAQRSEVSRIPHTGGLTKGQIALKAQRHQRAINRAASRAPVPAIATPSTPGRDALPIVLAGVALLVAVGSTGALAVGGARIRRSAQTGA